MSYAAQMKKLEVLRKREEREAKRKQKELEKRARERQKLSEQEAARLEVEMHENELEVLLSIHREQPQQFDWAAFAYALPVSPPVAFRKEAMLYELRDLLRGVLDVGNEHDMEAAAQADEAARVSAQQQHQRETAEWQKLRDVGRAILAGEPAAYSTAIAEYSNLAELSALGSGIHLTVHGPGAVEFTVTVKGKDVIPAEVKSLTSAKKLSVKAMPRTAFQAYYQDYVCGCVIRVARELFALLPLDTILAHAAVPAVDRTTGQEREMTILSVLFERQKFEALSFDRIDPSDTIESFPHRGSAKLSRGALDFQEIIPLTLSNSTPAQCSDGSTGADMAQQIAVAREVLRQSALKWLPQETAASIFTP